MTEPNFSVRSGAAGNGGAGPPSFGRRIATAMAVALLGLALAILLWYARELFLLAYAGTLLAVVLSWPADHLARHDRIPRPLSVIIVLGTLLLILLAGGFLLGNNIADQITELQKTLPSAFVAFRNNMRGHPAGQWLIDQTPLIQSYLTSPNLLAQLQVFVSSTFGLIGNVTVVFFVTIFLLFDPRLYVDGAVRLCPLPRRARARAVLERIGKTLRWWSLGQLCSMTAVGLLMAGGLTLLHVPLAGTLGVIAGLLNCIPNFGPIIAAIPGVLIAVAPSAGATDLQTHRALYVILLYLAVQSFDGMMMTPMIQRRAVSLPPALVLVFQFLMMFLVGPLGLILATPVLVALLVLVRMIYLEDILGDHAGPVPQPRLKAPPAPRPTEPNAAKHG